MEYQGCLDNQSPEEKEKNYKQSEVVMAVAPPIFPVKEVINFVKYPIRSQGSSGRCVAYTYAKELSIWFQQKYGEWVDFSTCFPYQLRAYIENAGCSSYDIYEIFPKLGNIFESFMPGDGLGEDSCMKVKMPTYAKDLAKLVNIKRISLPLDFDTVASTIQQTSKGVMLWFHFNNYEWKDIPIISEQPITSAHSICAVDIVNYKGQDYIVCDESWGIGYSMNGQRLISREYFNHRCFLASYLMNFKFDVNKDLEEKPKFDGSIISFQKCMRWEGLFPTNVPLVEVFGPVSKKACKDFQVKYDIKPALGNLGPITIAKIKSLYE